MGRKRKSEEFKKPEIVPEEDEDLRALDWLIAMSDHLNEPGIDRAHLILFLTHMVKTQDEHDPVSPFKKLPIETKPYLIKTAIDWLENPKMIIAKSRQVMVTWLFAAIFLWDTMFRKGRLNIIISRKEEDADKILTRIKGIYLRLPSKLQEFAPANYSPHGEIGAYCKLEFPSNDSKILGLSQDPNAIRSNTASNIFSDEMAFQERARETYTAMKPTIDGGGRIVCVSTPNGKEFFYKMFHDKTNGFKKLKIHYSMDLRKDGGWIEKAREGMDEDAWQQEQEINFTKAGGRAMFPEFSIKIHVKKLQVVTGRPLLCGIDFGFRHPALVIAQISDKDQLCALYEWMPSNIDVLTFGKGCLLTLKRQFPWHFYRRRQMIEWYCDPAGHQRNDKSEMTSIQILRNKLSIFCRSKRISLHDGISIVRQQLLRRSDATPGLLIDSDNCPLLIEGFQGGYEEQKPKEGLASREVPISDDTYSHTMDALRYIAIHKFKLFGRPYNPNRYAVSDYDPFDDESDKQPSKSESVTGYQPIIYDPLGD